MANSRPLSPKQSQNPPADSVPSTSKRPPAVRDEPDGVVRRQPTANGSGHIQAARESSVTDAFPDRGAHAWNDSPRRQPQSDAAEAGASHLPTPHSAGSPPPKYPTPESPLMDLSSRRASRPPGSFSQAAEPAQRHADCAVPLSHERPLIIAPFTPSPSPAHFECSSPHARNRTPAATMDVFDDYNEIATSTPTTSPSRARRASEVVETPSSYGRQESLPLTPSQTQTSWPIENPSHSPFENISRQRPDVDAAFVHSLLSPRGKRPADVHLIDALPLRESESSPSHSLALAKKLRDPIVDSTASAEDVSGPQQAAGRGGRSLNRGSIPLNPAQLLALSTNKSSSIRPVQTLEPSPEDLGSSRTMQPSYQGDTSYALAQSLCAERDRRGENEPTASEYSKTSKRHREPPQRAEKDGSGSSDPSLPGMGVTTLLGTGRRLARIEFVPPTSHAGHSAAGESAPQPRTPPRNRPPPVGMMSSMSTRAQAWVDSASPSTSPQLVPRAVDTSELDSRKRKRLAAFERAKAADNPLQVFNMAGVGRVLSTASASTLKFSPSNPKRAGKRKAGMQVSQETRRPDWPDQEFPWSLKANEREQAMQYESTTRLHAIERFLDRRSDSEEDDDRVVPSAESSQRRSFAAGRGKSINQLKRQKVRPVTVPEDPADARSVLLSRPEVLALAAASITHDSDEEPADESSENVDCVCHKGDDGRLMVRCDDCEAWFHLGCMDIQDEEELGDTWFCWTCSALRAAVEPEFSPTKTEVNASRDLDKPLFQMSGLEPSPTFDMRVTREPQLSPLSASRARARDRNAAAPSASSWLAEPYDPRGAPSTPNRTRRNGSFVTPGFFDSAVADDRTPFDPTSTPSRGLGNFGMTSPSKAWSSRAPLYPSTPGQLGGRSLAHFGDPFLLSPLDRFSRIVGEDTPAGLLTRSEPAGRGVSASRVEELTAIPQPNFQQAKEPSLPQLKATNGQAASSND